jgi:hypothetical protein
MKKFIKPTNLNGAELLNELNNAGIAITEKAVVDGNGDLWLDVSDKDKSAAEVIVVAHNGTIVAPEPTVEQKLANAGLNLEDLKVALGL